MSLRKSPERTAKFMAANRRNARKSTGPKTEEGKRRVAGNSYQHGFYATPDVETRQQMLKVGEEPDLLARFEREFTAAWQPSNAMEAMMVADLARMCRDKAILEKRVRAMRLKQMTSTSAREAPVDEQRLQEFGYLGIGQSTIAFAQCQKLLTRLAERVEQRNWGDVDELNETMRLLSDKPLQGWGKGIQRCFAGLASMNPETDQRPIKVAITDLSDHIAKLKAHLYEDELKYRNELSEGWGTAMDSQCVPGNRKCPVGGS